MITMLAGSVLLLAQAGTAAVLLDDGATATETSEVAFEAVAEGRSNEAIAEIERLLEEQPDDPALLINLGAAHAQQGDYQRAAECYRRAVQSDERYKLELADGRWVDSRLAARRALKTLEVHTVAMR